MVGIVLCHIGATFKNLDFDPKIKLFLKTGIWEGFTTFSTFSLETADLIKSGAIATAVTYVLLSIIIGVAAVVAGQFIFKN